MQKDSRLFQMMIILGVVVAIAVPLVFVALRNPVILGLMPGWLRVQITRVLQKTEVDSARYTVKNSLAGYTLRLNDTKYLDVVAADLHVFDRQAVVDPAYYKGNKTTTNRFTVSHMQFQLVPQMDFPPVSLIKQSPSFQNGVKWVVSADYTIENDTLVIREYMDIPELTKGQLLNTTSDDTFTLYALMTLYAASDKKYQMIDAFKLQELYRSMQKSLYSGYFPRPFHIEMGGT